MSDVALVASHRNPNKFSKINKQLVVFET